MREQLRARGQLRRRSPPRRSRRPALLGRERARSAGQDLEARGRQRSRTGRRSGTTHISVVDEAWKRRLADRVDRIGVGRDRAGDRRPHEQHAQRVRPQSGGPEGSSGSAPDEHDGAVTRPRSRAAPAGRGQRGLDRASRRSCRSSSIVVVHRSRVARAISAPRIHLDDGHVHCEGGSDPARARRARSARYELVRWRRRNLYFGGAAAVERLDDGSLRGRGSSTGRAWDRRPTMATG